MADYNITFPNGDGHTVLTGTIDNTYDIPLVGQDAINYGDDFATAYIRLLSNYSNGTAPSFGTTRVEGQLWYDDGTISSTPRLNVFDGTSWDAIPLDANVVHTTGAESILGIKTFSDPPDFTSGGSPFTVGNNTTVDNLTAEFLSDGGVPRAVAYFADSVQGAKADAAEPGLGNPGVNGYVLSSTTGGVRSWIAAGGGGSGAVDLVNITPGAATPGAMYVMLGDNATGVGETVYTHAAGLTYNGSSGVLTLNTVIANLTGTADNATLAATATVATGATNIDISSVTSTDGTTFPVLVGASSTGNQLPFIDNADFSYNANTGTLSATAFAGTGSTLTALNAGNITVGTLAVAYGGTGVNLATGTGSSVVLHTSPTFVTKITAPIVDNSGGVQIQWSGSTKIQTQSNVANDANSGATVVDGAGNPQNIGFNVMETNDVAAATTEDLTRATSGHSFRATNSTGVVIFATEAADADIPVGAVWIMRNKTTSTGTVTIQGGTGSTITHYDGSGTLVATVAAANPFTLARGGVATVVKIADDSYEMWGIGITGGA